VADIFQEVDEEVRRERLKQLWDRYSLYVIVGAVLIVAAVGGWRGYQWWQVKKAAEAGAAFESAILLDGEGKHAEAAEAFAKIATDGTAGYRLLARFREAAEIAAKDPKAALKLYEALAADSGIGQTLRDLATVRAALIQVDTAPYDEMRGRLEPLTATDRPFHASARELLALSAWHAADATNAKRWIDMILTDAKPPPPGVRNRIEVLNALIAAGGKS
jgi:hypothetical protein